MYKDNDRSFLLIRKIVAIIIIVFAVAMAISGIVLMILAFDKVSKGYGGTVTVFYPEFFFPGLGTLLLAPGVGYLGLLWYDFLFNIILDIKIIRDSVSENKTGLKTLPPLFEKVARVSSCQQQTPVEKISPKEEFAKYKEKYERGEITIEQFNYYKQKFLLSVTSKNTPAKK